MNVTVNTNARGIGAFAERLAALLDDAVEETAEAVTRTAKDLAPKDTGAMAASGYWTSWRTTGRVRFNAIRRARSRRAGVKVDPPQKPKKRGQALVVFPVFYAKYVERKTFFLAKARREHERTFRNKVQRAVRVAGKQPWQH